MDQVTDLSTAPRRAPLYGIRWPAVFAGLAVGISIQLLLTLIGMAAGLVALDRGTQADARTMSLAAGGWNTITMLIAASVGGYVAARTSGLRRTSDGVLHGLVSWAATMLLFAILATSAIGSMLGSMFGLVVPKEQQIAGDRNSGAAIEILRSLDHGDRQGALDVLQSRLELGYDDAGRVVDQASAIAGRQDIGAVPQDGARMASAASVWLSAASVLSLLAAVVGGAVGARGTRRIPHVEAHRISMPHSRVTITDIG